MLRTLCIGALFLAAHVVESDEPPQSCDPEDAECLASAPQVSLLQQEHWIVNAEGEVSSDEAQAPSGARSAGMAREAARVKLRVEQDLSKLSSEHYRAWNRDESCEENAANAFEYFMNASNMTEELDELELACFHNRFQEQVQSMCKNENNMTEGTWKKMIAQTFQDGKPGITEKVAAKMNDAHSGYYTVEKPVGCTSKKENDDKMGRKSSDAALLLQAERSGTELSEEINETALPRNFQSTKKWPVCADVISRIHQQGTCGSCWAFAGTSVLDSLICIRTKGAFQGQLSRTVLTSCASSGDGCSGGWEFWVYNYIKKNGVPTGSDSGCVPWFAHGEGTNHFTEKQSEPKCPKRCLHKGYDRSFREDSITIPKLGKHRLYFRPASGNWPKSKLNILKTHLMEKGSISYGIHANDAFMYYAGGIFDASCEGHANHAVVTIGWGKLRGKRGKGNYWHSLNSWGNKWGESGTYRVVDCVLTDFTIVGNLLPEDAENFPTHHFTDPKYYRAVDPTWTIKGNGCVMDADGCVASAGYPNSPYAKNTSCRIRGFPKIEVKEFNTEARRDKMRVNGKFYSGTKGPHGVKPKRDILWRSDPSVVATGWKICPDDDED